MGHAKNDMMNVQEREYDHSDKNVCAGCFGDPYLKSYIKKHGEYGSCSFCKDNNGKACRYTLGLGTHWGHWGQALLTNV